MASGAIKGITIKLGADASELTSALYKTEGALKNTQSQLRQVNSALKFNPNNVELLQQKFTLLQREISENDKYVEDLKKALQQMKNAGVDETADEFMTLQRAIIQAESKGESFRAELQQTKTALDNAERGATGLKNALNNVDTSKAKNQISTLHVAMGNLIANGISRLTNAIGNNLGAALERSDTLANFPKVMKGMGVGAKDASTAVDELAKGLEGLPTTLDAGASAVKSFTAVNGNVGKSTDYFLALNNAILAGGESADTQQTAIEQLSQAYAKGKPDMQEWRAIQQAMPAQLQQIAKSMGMTANELGEGLRNGTISMDDFLEQIVMLNDEGGKGFKSFADQAEDATGGLQTTLTELSTAITRGLQQAIDNIGRDKIVAVIKGISKALSTLISILGSVFAFVAQYSSIILPIVTALGTFAGILYGISKAVTTVKAAMEAWKAVQLLLNTALWANPIVLIVAGIVALGAAIYVAYQKSETFRNIVQQVGGVLAGVWGTIKSAAAGIGAAFSGLLTKAQNIVTKVKNTFTNLPKGIKSIGRDVITGIWTGMSNKVGWIKSKIKGFVGNVKNWLKRFFKIGSPSKLMADEIGRWIPAGIAKGMDDNQGVVKAAAEAMIPVATPTLSNISTEMTNAVGTGLTVANTMPESKPVHITINLGGAKVAEQIFKLNKQGQMVLEG